MADVTVAEMLRRFETLISDYDVIVWDSFDETGQAFGGLNTKGQMMEGKLNDGTPIVPNYSPKYAKRKDRTTPNLYNTGQFYAGYTLKADGATLQIGSDADYTKYLEQRYGTKIWGLTDTNVKKYAFGPYWSVFKPKIENVLKLSFT